MVNNIERQKSQVANRISDIQIGDVSE